MAGDWIKMRCNLGSDPRVLRMADGLKLPELHVVGLLWRFWSWADQHTTCDAISVTESLIDRITCEGFASQLREVGWLEVTTKGVVLTNFSEHNGQTAKQRALTQRRMKRKRDANVTQGASPEKRREEKRDNTIPPPEAGGCGKVEARVDERHHAITSAWGDLYRKAFGHAYAFHGRDAAALSRFLRSCKDGADTILRVAQDAWARTTVDRFAGRCKEAATIYGLCNAYNDIRVQLATPTSNGAVKTGSWQPSEPGGY